MGLQLLRKMPTGEGELVVIENRPVAVTPSEYFYKLKEAILALVEEAKGLASIRTDSEYERGVELIKSLSWALKGIETGMEPAKMETNGIKDQIMVYQHQLDVPTEKAKKALSIETARFSEDRETKRLAEEARLRREAEFERQRKQRKADLYALKGEIVLAKQAANDAYMRLERLTASEIRHGLKRFAALESTPGAFTEPLVDATMVKQLVAFALQHENARIAAAKARADGDKATARKIEQASAKLEAPEVAPVISERVEAAPVVVIQDELAKPKGGWVKESWKVKTVYNWALVPREFCEVSLSLLNQHAKRMGANASVPGVEFEREVKTIV